MRFIYTTTATAVKRKRSKGYTIEGIAKEHNLTNEEVRAVLSGTMPIMPYDPGTSEVTLVRTAVRLWQLAEEEPSEIKKQKTRRAIIGNFKDVSWADFLEVA